MKLTITIKVPITLTDDGILCTPDEYDSFKDDPETMHEVFWDEICDHAGFVENWKVEVEP